MPLPVDLLAATSEQHWAALHLCPWSIVRCTHYAPVPHPWTPAPCGFPACWVAVIFLGKDRLGS